MINLEMIPLKKGIIVGEKNTLEILIRASGSSKYQPELHKRLPLNLSLVIDRSGSMQGRPLEEAKKSAIMLIDRMDETDQLSVVTYDNLVDVVFPPTKVTNKPLLKSLITGITQGGMTALFDGWSVGADLVSLHSDDAYFSRVLLLSDGQANQGLTDPKIISSSCQVMAEKGVTTSTYGLGLNFNEDLMTTMAKYGQGQAHYGQTANDLIEPFHEEFDLMEAILARRLKLQIMPELGVSFEILNGYSQNQEGRFNLPDLALGADVWALARVTLAEGICKKALGSSVKALTASIDFLDTEGVDHRSKTSEIKLEIISTDAYDSQDVNETVQQRTLELRAALLQEQAHVAAREENWGRIDQIMAELEGLAQNSAWIKVSLERLKYYSTKRSREEFSKEAHYKSTRLRSRSIFRDENIKNYSPDAEVHIPSYLRRKLEQGKKQS